MVVVPFHKPEPAHKPAWERAGNVGDETKYVYPITDRLIITLMVGPRGSRYFIGGEPITDRQRMALAAALSSVGRPDGQDGGR